LSIVLEDTLYMQVVYTIVITVPRLRVGLQWNRGSILGRGKNFVSYPRHPKSLCGTPSLLFNQWRGLLS